MSPDVRSTNAQSLTVCPDCGSAHLRSRGRIPDGHYFAGMRQETPLPGGRLMSCMDCDLCFRDTQLTKEMYDRLYSLGKDDNWSQPPSVRPDWALASRWIAERQSCQRILDVGCFDGRFLWDTDTAEQRFGIEVHAGAARAAAKRGITIVGSDASCLCDGHLKFDTIVAFDIIEHLASPRRLLAQLVESLNSGGSLIVGTGNSSAPSFRFMGGAYWYCGTAEHISFINPSWCRRLGEKLGIKVRRLALLSHYRASPWQLVHQPIVNAAYRFAPRSFCAVRHGVKRLVRGKNCGPFHQQPPVWSSAKDHMLVEFTR